MPKKSNKFLHERNWEQRMFGIIAWQMKQLIDSQNSCQVLFCWSTYPLICLSSNANTFKSIYTHLRLLDLFHGDQASWGVAGECLLTVTDEPETWVKRYHLLTVPERWIHTHAQLHARSFQKGRRRDTKTKVFFFFLHLGIIHFNCTHPKNYMWGLFRVLVKAIHFLFYLEAVKRLPGYRQTNPVKITT